MRRSLLVNGALVALALGTLGVVWATRDVATSGELAARKNQLFREFTPAEVSALTLTKGGHTLELRRDGSDFRIVKPWLERADIATVNKWLGAADMATAERSADGVSDQRAGFDSGAFRATVTLGGKKLVLTLGGPAPTPTGARYAKVESEAGAARSVVRGSVATELDVPFDSFRETRLLEYGKRELARIEIDDKDGKVELEQRAHGAFFVRVGANWELASTAVDSITGQLAQLSTELFVDPAQARAALAGGALRMKLILKDASVAPVSLSVGGVCPTDPERVVLLREQAGKSARAGCIAASALASLTPSQDALRLQGPFSANVSEIEELRIVRGGQKLELARKDKAFVLRSPGSGEVPLNVGNQRIAAILGARGELAATDLVGAGEGEISIQVTGGDEEAHREERVLLGKRRPDNSVCFKRVTDAVTRCVTEAAARDLEPDARLLKSLTLLSFAPSELSSLRVEAPDFEERLVRNADGGYELQEPKGYAYDAARVTDAVQGLGTLEATRWVAAEDHPEFGLAKPALQVFVQLTAEPAARELRFGTKVAGGRYARLSPAPDVFVLDPKLYLLLHQPLIDRALCPFDETELSRIEVRSGSGKPRTLDGRLREALGALRASYVTHLGAPRADEGFERPGLEISFVSKAEKRTRVRIGSASSRFSSAREGDLPLCYARRDDVDATFTIEGAMAQSLIELMKA